MPNSSQYLPCWRVTLIGSCLIGGHIILSVAMIVVLVRLVVLVVAQDGSDSEQGHAEIFKGLGVTLSSLPNHTHFNVCLLVGYHFHAQYECIIAEGKFIWIKLYGVIFQEFLWVFSLARRLATALLLFWKEDDVCCISHKNEVRRAAHWEPH